METGEINALARLAMSGEGLFGGQSLELLRVGMRRAFPNLFWGIWARGFGRT